MKQLPCGDQRGTIQRCLLCATAKQAREKAPPLGVPVIIHFINTTPLGVKCSHSPQLRSVAGQGTCSSILSGVSRVLGSVDLRAIDEWVWSLITSNENIPICYVCSVRTRDWRVSAKTVTRPISRGSRSSGVRMRRGKARGLSGCLTSAPANGSDRLYTDISASAWISATVSFSGSWTSGAAFDVSRSWRRDERSRRRWAICRLWPRATGLAMTRGVRYVSSCVSLYQ